MFVLKTRFLEGGFYYWIKRTKSPNSLARQVKKGILKLVQNDLTVTQSRRHRNYVKADAN